MMTIFCVWIIAMITHNQDGSSISIYHNKMSEKGGAFYMKKKDLKKIIGSIKESVRENERKRSLSLIHK